MNKNNLKKISKTLILIIIGAIIGFYISEGLNNLHAKPSLNVIMPITYNDEGEFPITIMNKGGVDLDIRKVHLQSCYMKEDEWRHYYPDDLPSGKDYVVPFSDEKTFNKSQRIDCLNNPLEDWQSRRMDVTICKNMVSGEVFVPDKNNSFTMCGFCFWNISIETNKGKFDFYEEMFLPVDFDFEVLGLEENPAFDINSPDVICTDNFKITYYGMRELEIEGEYD